MKRIRLQKSAESAQSADRFLAFGTLNQEQHSRGRPPENRNGPIPRHLLALFALFAAEGEPVENELEDLGMRLFHLMGALRRYFARNLISHDLTFPQFMALCSLEHAEGKASRMGDLATATHQSAASMTGVVDRLLEQALVERRLDPADRRSVLVALTDEGARLLERVRADRIQAMEQLLRSLSAEERALLYDILGKLLSELSGETTPVGQL